MSVWKCLSVNPCIIPKPVSLFAMQCWFLYEASFYQKIFIKYICYRNFDFLTNGEMRRDEYGFNKVWTSDCTIMVMEEGFAKPKEYTWATLESMILLRFTLWKKTLRFTSWGGVISFILG